MDLDRSGTPDAHRVAFVPGPPDGELAGAHLETPDHDGAPDSAAALPARRAAIPSRAELGPLSPAVADGSVTDLFVNADGSIWVDRGGGAHRFPGIVLGRDEAKDLAVHLIALGGRHLDEGTPCVDVRLGDGVRVHAVLPPISPGGALLSIRLPRAGPLGLDELGRGGAFDRVGGVARVRSLVAGRANLLITGAAGSGKTTLLAAMLGCAASTERIVAIEDVAELRVQHPHFVALESRQANLEGAGEVGLGHLLREALRMRPDRLVVGECRGAELRELLGALNTGHDGGAGTMHANSLADVPARLEALGAVAGLSGEATARQSASAFDRVLHVERDEHGRRVVAAIGRLALDDRDRLTMAEADAETETRADTDAGAADAGYH